MVENSHKRIYLSELNIYLMFSNNKINNIYIYPLLAMALGLAGIYFGKKMKKWAEDQQAKQAELKRQKEESKKEQEG